MLEFIVNWLQQVGASPEWAGILSRFVAILLMLLLSLLANYVAKQFILNGLKKIISRTRTQWDDVFLERKVLNQLAHLAPALVIYLLTPIVFEGMDRIASAVISMVLIYFIVVLLLAIDAFLNALLDIYRTYDISRELPLKSFMQVVKIVLYFIAGIFIISIILDKTPFFLLSGLGALTAVLMLIFRDPILGFVAGIQLSANKMLAPGDWVEMPKYGADGDVLEVTLTTVKIQNWDKTITTIPTYSLITESFKNWRGMSESGGRRIKRSINIDMNTIKFCDEEMLERFARIRYISEYIEKKKNELAEYNKSEKIDESSLVNGRRMTNIGTFRAYVTAYLKNHPMIRQDMTFLVRQLKPTEFGLPIEIYVFSKDQVWANYERIQADIFDHFFAVIPQFDLRVYQNPTGYDFAKVLDHQSIAHG